MVRLHRLTRSKKADHDYLAQELELRHNTHLTELLHTLTVEIHKAVNPAAAGETDTGENAGQVPTATASVAVACHTGPVCAVYMVTDNKQRESCERS